MKNKFNNIRNIVFQFQLIIVIQKMQTKIIVPWNTESQIFESTHIRKNQKNFLNTNLSSLNHSLLLSVPISHSTNPTKFNQNNSY